MKLGHVDVKKLYDSGVMTSVSSYNDLDNAIYQFGCNKNFGGAPGSDEYNHAAGMAWEIWSEWWFKYFGNQDIVGIHKIQDFSENRYNVGYDKIAENNDLEPVIIQEKWRKNSSYKFREHELTGTLATAYKSEIKKKNIILFTNLYHDINKNNGSVFHYSFDDALTYFRVIDRHAQEFCINNGHTSCNIWEEFRQSLKESASFVPEIMPKHEDGQQRVMEAVVTWMDSTEPKATIIVATGGGKTNIEYDISRLLFDVSNLFASGVKNITLVAPTIALCAQHAKVFHKFGLFYNTGIQLILFNSGGNINLHNGGLDLPIINTTDPKRVTDCIIDKIPFICIVTVASLPKVTEIFHKNGDGDLLIADEYQNLISQQIDPSTKLPIKKDCVKNLPWKKQLFASASAKRGRIMDALDSTLFGKIIIEITFKELQDAGILKPAIDIILVHQDDGHLKDLTKQLREEAADEGYDIESAAKEAGSLVCAYNDAATKTKMDPNFITFTKSISNAALIFASNAIRNLLPEVIFEFMHAGTSAKERERILLNLNILRNIILLHHSCASEGIDIPGLDNSFVARTMGQIPTLQGPIGRIMRADPEDRKNFKKGVLTRDDESKWNHSTGRIYVQMDSENKEIYRTQLIELASALMNCGLDLNDCEFHEFIGDRKGFPVPTNDWMNKPSFNVNIRESSLKDAIDKAWIEAVQIEKNKDAVLLRDNLNEIATMDEFMIAIMDDEQKHHYSFFDEEFHATNGN